MPQLSIQNQGELIINMQAPLRHGIKNNIRQFSLHLVQIFLVGLTIGMTRIVIPGLAESEFGLANKAWPSKNGQ